MSTTGGDHDKCGERSLGKELSFYGNPGVLMICPHTHHGIPLVYRTTPGVLNNIPWCTEHLPVYCTDNQV